MSEDINSVECSRDLRKLVEQRQQRPSFSRMISWELGHAADQQPARRTKTRRKQNSGNKDQTPDEVEEQDDDEEYSLSDSSEYETAQEEDDEEENILEKLSGNSDGVDGQISEQGDADTSYDVEGMPSASGVQLNNSQNGRKRRLSKKQKRKRKTHFKTMYLDELYNLGNLCDPSEDIENVFTSLPDEGIMGSEIERNVPSLVELCLAASTRKLRTNSEKGKSSVVQQNRGDIPYLIKYQLSSYGKGMKEQQKLLSYILNRIIPLGLQPNCEQKLNNMFYFEDSEKNEFCILKRAVWKALPYLCKECTCNYIDSQIPQEQATAYLYAPVLCKDKSLCYCSRKAEWKTDSRWKFVVDRLKSALQLRFKRALEKLFHLALPYAMWARGHVTIATDLFKHQLDKETDVIQKAMYLSEIARMHAQFGECKTAIQFYRLAGETVLSLPTGKKEKLSVEVTEQTQILIGNACDRGVLDKEKCQQSSSYWGGARNLPNPDMSTVLASMDVFISLYAGQYEGCEGWRDGIEKMAASLKSCPYLYYYQSLLYALLGDAGKSREAYTMLKHNSMIVPGAGVLALLGKRKWSPWQPLLEMKQQSIPPLKVIWRVQLQHCRLQDDSLSPQEAQLCSKALNLRINERGLICGDLQQALPPMRDLNFDPYTGAHVLSPGSGHTSAWQSAFHHSEHDSAPVKCPFPVPTPCQIYMGKDGTTVHLINPKKDNEMEEMAPKKPSPFLLQWRDSRPHQAIPGSHIIKGRQTTQVIDVAFNKVTEARKKVAKQEKVKKWDKQMADLSGLWKSDFIDFQVWLSQEPVILDDFVDTKSRERFLDVKTCRVSHSPTSNFRVILPNSSDFFIYRPWDTSFPIGLVNKFGELVQEVKYDNNGSDRFTPVVLGPDFYVQIEKTSIARIAIGTGEQNSENGPSVCNICDEHIVWTLAPYITEMVKIAGDPTIEELRVIGGQCKTVGIGLLVTEVMEFVDIVVNDKSGMVYSLSEDKKVILGNFANSKILSEKSISTAEDKSITQLVIAVENNLLFLEVVSEMRPENLAFGANILVSLTQHDKASEHYREHLFYYDLAGNLHGALPCLGRGPRSFLPLYLSAADGGGEEREAGWRVYMRDERDGIICVKLHKL
ncbi:hypothetical protein MAR_018169 [Mya arenaria]|uniref:Uncharacterized protein n=1 Tax=Mya arenaria TaxID=6604 RepID=A0ABY7EHC9_MYAAR|nr:hypothetical protein MAR_018169 [Mya arenaria]